jgi:hypothetical protein
MTGGGRLLAGIAVAAVVAAGCTSSSATWPGLESAATSAPSSVVATGSASSATQAALPPAPTNFTAAVATRDAACPSDQETQCWEWEFTWDSTADSSTRFRVYRGYASMMGDEPCSSVVSTAEVLVESDAGARSVKYVEEPFVGTVLCHWVSAFNDAGESPKVGEADAQAGVLAPPAPTSFTAELVGNDVACPAGQEKPCWEWHFTWGSSAESATSFRIYRAAAPLAGECADVVFDAELALEADAGARSEWLVESMPLGLNDPCHWITAANEGGESDMVEAGR